MIRASGRALRRLLGLVLMLAVAAAAGIGALAWRLAQGPLPLDQLARAMEDYVNRGDGGVRVSIGSAALAWEGFGGGIDRPLDIRLADVRVLDSAGAEAVVLPEGEVSLGLRSLLLGRFEPRAVRLRGLRIAVLRGEDGALSLDLGGGEAPAPERGPGAANDHRLLAEFGLAPAPAGTTPRFAELRRLVVTAAEVTVDDRQLGARWTIPDATLSLQRRPVARGTAIVLEASGVASADAARLPVRLAAEIGPDGAIEGEIALEAARPAELAAALPALSALAAVEAPAVATLRARRASDGTLASAELRAELGAGGVVLPGGSPLPLTSARLSARYDPSGITLDSFTLVLPGTAGPSPTLTLSGAAIPDADGDWIAEARIRLDALSFADLPKLWPEGVAMNERRWIAANITTGLARELDIRLRAIIPPSRDELIPERISGTVRGENLTVHYLRPMPPVEGVAAVVTFASLAEIDIATKGGRLGGITVPEGRVRLFDLDRRPNRAEVTLRIESAVEEALALIAHPKLDLFSRRGAPPPGITGRGELSLSLAFPLLDALTLDEIDVAVSARARDLRVPALLAGRDLERGRAELTASRTGLRLAGTGVFGPIQAEVTGEMDFRSGPPTQVVERYTAKASPQEGLAALFDLDLAPYLTGPIGAEATLELRRNGQGAATVRADLARARLAVPELGVEKPPGHPGTAEARLALGPGGRLTGADLVRLEAGDIFGRARFRLGRDGRLERIEVTEARLSESRLSGSVLLPERPGGDYAVTLRAPVIDLSRRSREADQTRDPGRAQPTLVVDAAIDRLVFRPGHELREVRGRGALARGVIARAEASALAGQRGTMRLAIAPEGPGRRSFTLTADDAGAVLNALDVLTTMAGGTLTIRGIFDDTQPGHPLTGEAELLDFRLREAPAAARVLQAMTLYGVLDLARGPGVSFTRAVASFTWDDRRLELRDARAISASLGVTAQGTIDRANGRIDLEGTIVPAYVFNSLLGRIPVIGRLFSPEQGGGVFAASYRVRGPLDDPEATVNPLAALTPGFLRGLFGIFEGGQQGPPQSPPGTNDSRQGGG
ncbi:DUF3971 domain-containing protein [Elioraea tepida]|uniref:DUF3971 domain-containing protein n=1 Tax=Elioraea tepida TaxID=2843330 RepID=A0A975TZU3_9PROT|nr:DUF3971 domain-containing protein [Elioraea tepida]QXM23671.1 DUF3971 domain-containing protein [Elioraea tepida]